MFLHSALFLLTLAQGQQPRHPMPSFASDSEMVAFLRHILERRGALMHRTMISAGQGAPAQAQAALGAKSDESITNVQHAGVDEGDIVKLHGDYLVILRRGRLFTVAVGGNALSSVSGVDAFGPNIDPANTWYDEMLISGDKVVVIGYSYERGGTEVGVFHLGDDGSLRYRYTFQLRSNDYYSSRNYASRLVGTRLVFYSPLYLPWSVEKVSDLLPAVRHWHGQHDGGGFRTLAEPARVYRPEGWQAEGDVALHTVTSCDLAARDVECNATVVIGPPGNVFYVSDSAVFVWMSGWRGRHVAGSRESSLLARLPLDGSAPTSVRVAGSPVDQFSFNDDGDGWLNVLVRGDASGDGMWSAERTGGFTSLLRLPLDEFGDGSGAAPHYRYRPLPSPSDGDFQNRFVGDFLLYGVGNGWGPQQQSDSALYLVRYRGGDPATLYLSHSIDRIEVMGSQAVVVGVRSGSLEFSGIRLGRHPAVEQRYTLAHASQGELRSHGFFYREDRGEEGIFGLPVREEGRPGWSHLVEGSASILFVRNEGGLFASAGSLRAGEVRNTDDACRASCVDWYGNARPIFFRGRVLALMGYELVEGRLEEGAIREVRRLNYAPRAVAVSSRAQ